MKLKEAHDFRAVPQGLLSPGLLDEMIREETRIRVALPTSQESPPEQARALLRSAAALCELIHVAAVTIEQAGRISPGGRSLLESTRLDVATVLRENAELFGKLEPADSRVEATLPQVLSAVQSVLRECPVRALAEVGKLVDAPESVARIQVAMDALRAFVRRNDPWMDQRLKVVGEQYRAGKLGTYEVARVLDLPVSDAVALLESHGYSRSLERATLPDETRRDLFEAMDRDRVERHGRPDPSPAAVARDVIASQRIEGVDARRWFEEKLK